MKVRSVDIEWLGHSGFLIVHDGKRIAIDPYQVSDGVEPVDLILITHSHYDHCSVEDIQKLYKDGTAIAVTADAQSKVNKIEGIDLHMVNVGLKSKVAGTSLYVFPAYNVNKDFHPQNEGWVGYLIKLGDVIIYHAGDTDNIPEMQGLQGVNREGEEFVVLLPVSGKYVMDAQEAADAAAVIQPNIAIPMHYGSEVAGTLEDAQKFRDLCQEKNIRVEILEKI